MEPCSGRGREGWHRLREDCRAAAGTPAAALMVASGLTNGSGAWGRTELELCWSAGPHVPCAGVRHEPHRALTHGYSGHIGRYDLHATGGLLARRSFEWSARKEVHQRY